LLDVNSGKDLTIYYDMDMKRQLNKDIAPQPGRCP